MVYHVILFDMEEYHTKHVTYKIAYHFVWYPKYRKQILVGDIAQFVESEIRRLCQENKWSIGALDVQEDHVHLFLSAEPRTAPSLIANTLKGISARQVFKRFPEVKKQLWVNTSILDAGWGTFVSMCSIKAAWAGRTLVKVSPKFTSQVCSGCGQVRKKELSERWHSCECGTELDCDVNAAINILERGRRQCGVTCVEAPCL